MADAVGDPSLQTPSLPINHSIIHPAQKSYASAASQKQLSKYKVDISVVDGKARGVVPEEVSAVSTHLWDDFLVGRFPDTAPHEAKIHVIVNKIWNLGDKNIKIDVFKVNDNMVKFRIRHPAARLRALRRGMWNICDLPMFVAKWSPIAEEAQPEIRSMPMWITIKNVPHSMFSWEGLSFLASPVGDPKKLHRETELVTNFEEAKIFVEVDLTKVLLTEFYFQLKGEEVSVQYEYPWLPPRCTICGKWGHVVAGCLANAGRRIPAPASVSSPKKSEEILSSQILQESVNEAEAGAIAQGAVDGENGSRGSLEELEFLDQVVNQEKKSFQEENPISEEFPANSSKESSLEKEKEEGEIDEKEWTSVTPKGGRKSNHSSPELKFGQVRIATSRFDVLQIQEENDDSSASVEPAVQDDPVGTTNPAAPGKADTTKDKEIFQEKTEEKQLLIEFKKAKKQMRKKCESDEGVPTVSKNAKNLRAKDLIQSKFGKQYSKKKN